MSTSRNSLESTSRTVVAAAITGPGKSFRLFGRRSRRGRIATPPLSVNVKKAENPQQLDPTEDGRGPREAGAEPRHEHVHPRSEPTAAHRLVECDRDRRRRRVREAVERHERPVL